VLLYPLPPWHVYSVALSMSGGVALGTALLLGAVTAVPVPGIAVAFLVVAFLGYSLVSIRWIDSNGRTRQ